VGGKNFPTKSSTGKKKKLGEKNKESKNKFKNPQRGLFGDIIYIIVRI
jgi:hypothetical protein